MMHTRGAIPILTVLVLWGSAGCGDDGGDDERTYGAGGGFATGGVGSGGLGSGGVASGGLGLGGYTSAVGGVAAGGLEPGGNSSGGFVTGGATTTTGGATTMTGGATTMTGGATTTTGGTTATTGGTRTGGTTATTGGTRTGGTSSGGTRMGGTSSGGTSSGSTSSGGTSTTGGTTACSFPEPPANVAAWIDESWSAQLDDNVRGRRAWLLDNAMMGQGEINLCVRWGATTAPSAAVKTNLAPTVERWMNAWFTALGDYGCFPYPNGVKVKVTGWAVRPGNQSWVSDLGSSVAVYTETDGEGEPKCPDACSFFVHWDHQFPSCPGGPAFHTDYWIWLDDQLPGGGGAAAVGGDWGLRMPVAAFVNSMSQTHNGVVEHEIGHGFGLQDYYDWTGARPTGGSLMIVGSANMSNGPTVGDTWLIRRTWKEQKALRGW